MIRARRAAHVQSIVRLVRGASESPDARTRAGECTSADGPEARTERDGNESGAAEGTHQALFKSILVLSGADAAMRDDATLSSYVSPFRRARRPPSLWTALTVCTKRVLDRHSDMLPIRHLTLDAARGAASASTTSQQEGSLQARLASCAPALDLSLPSTNAKGRSAALAHSGLTLEILHALSLASQGGRDADTSNNHNNGSGRKALDAGALVAFAAEGQNTTLVRALAFATAQAVGLSDSLPRLATPTSQAQERDDDDDEMGDGVQARTEADEIDWREPPTWRVGLMGQDLSTQARADIYG